MFALDLFNNDHERRLAEGAVDQLEQRRIDDLAMKMDDLVARARQVKDPAHKAALVKEFQKCKAERDSYYKIKDECMGYGGLTSEAGIPGNVPTEKIPGKEDLLKGKGRSYYEEDGIPGNVPADKIPGKEDLLKGKGRSYYEAQDQKKNSEEVDEAGHKPGWALDPKTRLELKKRKERQKTIAKWAGKPVPPQEKEINEEQKEFLYNVECDGYDKGNFVNKNDAIFSAQYMIYYGEKEYNSIQVKEIKTGDVIWEWHGKKDDNDVAPTEIEVDEGWSDAIVAQRTGRPRTPYSVYIKGKKWKDFENEDHAEAVANKLRAKFKADGRDPNVITIAPTDYDKGMNEDSSTSSEAAERAILNRIMVAHLDLLKEFGPQKVMQAVEEVAYNVGDLDEIGSSDVSAWVNEVRQILGATNEKQLDEKWSEKYKRSIDCSHPKGFSQKAHCAGRKK